MDDVAINVENLSKTFKLPHERNDSIKSALVNFGHGDKGYEVQQALKNISFQVKKGEFFGIVGRNGSGKSTLLKILAGIYTPNSGIVQINGKLTPFIELGVGFSPDLTGRENVYLNGSLLGFNRKEMDAMYNDIVEFAELERFMDQKLKNYSSGMQVRLAFSIAIRAKSDILVLDEVLAVGDAAFQQKCFDYFEKLKKDQETIVLVTHDMSIVKRFCSRAMLIDKSKIKIIGSADEVANQYLFENLDTKKQAKVNEKYSLKHPVKSLDLVMKSPKKIENSENLVFDVEYELSEDLPVYLGFSVMYGGLSMVEHNSKDVSLEYKKGKKHVVRYELPLKKFNTDSFKINITIFNLSNSEPLGYKVDACNFLVTAKDKNKGGPVNADGQWSVII